MWGMQLKYNMINNVKPYLRDIYLNEIGIAKVRSSKLVAR